MSQRALRTILVSTALAACGAPAAQPTPTKAQARPEPVVTRPTPPRPEPEPEPEPEPRDSRVARRLVGPRTGVRATNTHPTAGTGLPPMSRPSSKSQS